MHSPYQKNQTARQRRLQAPWSDLLPDEEEYRNPACFINFFSVQLIIT